MEGETDDDKGYREKRARTIVIPTKLSALSQYGLGMVSLNDALNYN